MLKQNPQNPHMLLLNVYSTIEVIRMNFLRSTRLVMPSLSPIKHSDHS
jgi:hypothetical protein